MPTHTRSEKIKRAITIAKINLIILVFLYKKLIR
nr:MAG TPA: hypothetical protein [Caudoviricetes sp.]